MIINYVIFYTYVLLVSGYTNHLFTLVKEDFARGIICGNDRDGKGRQSSAFKTTTSGVTAALTGNFSFPTVKVTYPKLKDPIDNFDNLFEEIIYGIQDMDDPKPKRNNTRKEDGIDPLAMYPTGQVMRAEKFHNKSSVHLSFAGYMHPGHLHLKITHDYMQTAIDAFNIILLGTVEDVLRLPPLYILNSARTIAMMKIPREKLVAMWSVVKDTTPTASISFETLQKFRALFKYINGKEMARLNLMDERILAFIGTHPDLTRHQVGVVANRYINLNPNWTKPQYLNRMNNLLCGVPMIFMRRIPRNIYLQLNHQLFYHIRACDPLQRKFYYQMMTRTQALGKSYSWSARDVSRLGLLLAEIDGPSLSAIYPRAMSGITSQVMLEIPAEALQYVTEIQMRYLEPRALNILMRKVNTYRSVRQANSSTILDTESTLIYLISTMQIYLFATEYFCRTYLVLSKTYIHLTV